MLHSEDRIGARSVREKKLRILVLADSRSFHVERWVSELRRQDCRVLVASLEHGRMHHYHLRLRGPGPLNYALASSQIRTLIRRFRPDILNPHFASGYGFATALANRKRPLPIFLNLWGSDILIVPHKSGLHQRKTAFALEKADFVSADSEYIIEAASKITPLKDTLVIPWGLEEAYLALHKQVYEFRDRLTILVPRPHERVYNNLFIVRALTPLINEGKITITFPSFGSLVDHFRSTAQTLVGDRIKYYDKLPRSEFMRFMSEHDAYLSSAISDSSPVSLIESMGLGLIPIAADIPGVREWMAEGGGYLYQPYNAGELRNLLGRLVDEGNDHRHMRETNLARVKHEARYEQNVADSIGIMQRLAHKGQA